MKVAGKNVDGIEVIRISAKALDADSATEFTRQLEPLVERSDRVVLDLEDVAFVDSTGLGAILSCLRRLDAEGISLRICRPARAVRSVMRMVGMHRVVETFDTLEEALGSFHTQTDTNAA